ncbi:AAA family ATPase [Bacillus cereus]|uniref:AAA family ATPase n=1 Tax=Bacillus cereus TaxID=1396 RepID=UPI0018F329A9|nr:ATP-binding protein [Bacillus cereus]MBJ7983001.1 AAA family ATPase [Bacillus cereus]
MKDIYEEYAHIVRLSLEGKQEDVMGLAKKNIRYINKTRPDIASKLKNILNSTSNYASVIRKNVQDPLPIDIDSKLELIKREYFEFDEDPVWPDNVWVEMDNIIMEREFEKKLISKGLSPTKSALFVGPPGVGKTLAAQWISYKLNKPLLTLDLAAVMSSYLGRTGNNIRAVLDYAKKTSCILLLDEFDAIAKKRNDDSEIGELKRLVTVLLQAVDEWPPNGILIAATNHPELLDPAVWRRFERVVEFPNPSYKEIYSTISSLLKYEDHNEMKVYIDLLSNLFEGSSFSEIIRNINLARKESIVKDIEISKVLEELSLKLCQLSDRSDRVKTAKKLLLAGHSQRKTSEITGVSRETLRKYIKNGEL